MAEKSVYVLGAGFSMDARAPSQAQLLGKIFDSQMDASMASRRSRLGNFLKNTLAIPDEKINDTPLEDIYTPIDRCLSDGVSLRDCNPASIRVIREDLECLISEVIDQSMSLALPADRQYLDDFATFLVDKAEKRADKARHAKSAHEAKNYDPLSIISLNWDMALDSAIHCEVGRRILPEHNEYSPIGVVDYCCYISSYDEHDWKVKPGLWALGARGYNVKLLKLHGSMNWLQCLSCQRLYVSFDKKIILGNRGFCRHCERCGIRGQLQGSLVMPTFLKDLSNFQIKLVWQNAGVELMEANKVVFIGYSLPMADFEFRQLLTRMLRRDAKVHVVLKGTPNEFEQSDVYRRYDQFFAGRHITYDLNGTAAYVDKLVRSTCSH